MEGVAVRQAVRAAMALSDRAWGGLQVLQAIAKLQPGMPPVAGTGPGDAPATSEARCSKIFQEACGTSAATLALTRRHAER
jgi:hypothetical protein